MISLSCLETQERRTCRLLTAGRQASCTGDNKTAGCRPPERQRELPATAGGKLVGVLRRRVYDSHRISAPFFSFLLRINGNAAGCPSRIALQRWLSLRVPYKESEKCLHVTLVSWPWSLPSAPVCLFRAAPSPPPGRPAARDSWSAAGPASNVQTDGQNCGACGNHLRQRQHLSVRQVQLRHRVRFLRRLLRRLERPALRLELPRPVRGATFATATAPARRPAPRAPKCYDGACSSPHELGRLRDLRQRLRRRHDLRKRRRTCGCSTQKLCSGELRRRHHHLELRQLRQQVRLRADLLQRRLRGRRRHGWQYRHGGSGDGRQHRHGRQRQARAAAPARAAAGDGWQHRHGRHRRHRRRRQGSGSRPSGCLRGPPQISDFEEGTDRYSSCRRGAVRAGGTRSRTPPTTAACLPPQARPLPSPPRWSRRANLRYLQPVGHVRSRRPRPLTPDVGRRVRRRDLISFRCCRLRPARQRRGRCPTT